MNILNMSDLQISLIIIGIIVIAGVAIFNWVQQYRYRRKIQAAFDQKHDDALLSPHDTEEAIHRIEPKFNKSPIFPPAPDFKQELSEQTDKVIPSKESLKKISHNNNLINTTPSPALNSSNALPVLDFDNNTNYIAIIKSASIIPNTHVAKLLQRKFDFGKPVYWLGQQNQSEPWEEITREVNIEREGYESIKGCLQLADRAGPINEINLAKFRDLVQDFASQISAQAECPDIVSSHEKAVALDRFCAEVDVMIGINIISKDDGAFIGTKIRALAEASGFRLESEGLFKYRDENNNILFTLTNYEPSPFLPENIKSLTTHGVTFLLDVPRISHGDRVFDQMTHLAKIFTNTLGGIMVDDNRVPLSEGGILRSKQQLLEIQNTMKKHQINAGSACALRLFE